MSKVVIIGAGLAGLSAGIHLLERNPAARVRILEMGHQAGGRAKSFRTTAGINVNHGFHALFEFYSNFRDLLKRAGINEKESFVSSKSISYFYEEDTKLLHQLGLKKHSLTGKIKGTTHNYSLNDSAAMLGFGIKNHHAIYTDKKIEKYDDVCYTAWALENGLDKYLAEKRWFRFTRDAYFNWPHEISAYVALKSARYLKNPGYFYINGNYGETIFKPLMDYFLKLGGEMVIQKKLLSVVHKEGKITGIKTAIPDPAPHLCGTKQWMDKIPIDPNSISQEEDFDELVLTTPIDSFKELNEGDEVFWKGFEGVKNLRTVITLSWQLWTKEPVLPAYWGSINGLDEPMGTVIDYKQLIDEYKNNPDFGSVIEWVGQENGFEGKSDEELKEIILDSFMKIPGAKNPMEAGIIHDVFRRNRANHQRFFLTEPGVNKFRPSVETHFPNLFLAGDWIRNEVDLPTMEGAVRAGIEAANAVLNKK